MTRLRQFPLAKRFAKARPYDQYRAMVSETYEVSDALRVNDLTHAAHETWDVIHACETMLHILEERGVDVQAVRREVEAKNLERGYYG